MHLIAIGRTVASCLEFNTVIEKENLVFRDRRKIVSILRDCTYMENKATVVEDSTREIRDETSHHQSASDHGRCDCSERLDS